MKMSRDTLGLAAEYAVASELCRRNIYAELAEHNVPIFVTEVNASGKPYKGMGVRPAQIKQHKEQ